MADIRRDENFRESWYITNNSSDKITIGDLPLVPTIDPDKTVDILKYYTREKISHSTDLANLVKREILSLNKKKIYTNALPGIITTEKVDEAITPAEENELIDKVTEGQLIDDEVGGILLHGKDYKDTAQPVGIAGVENDEIKIGNIEIEDVLENIIKELRKINLQMSFITSTYLRDQDIETDVG